MGFDRCGKREQPVVWHIQVLDSDQLGLALRQRSGLVDDECIDLLQRLERLGIADQHARMRTAAGSDHYGHRRGESERTGTGDDEDGDSVEQRMRQPRLGTDR